MRARRVVAVATLVFGCSAASNANTTSEASESTTASESEGEAASESEGESGMETGTSETTGTGVSCDDPFEAHGFINAGMCMLPSSGGPGVRMTVDWGPRSDPTLCNSTFQMEAGDFDGDGNADLMVYDFGVGLEIWLTDPGTESWGSTPDFTTSAPSVANFLTPRLGDFDGDGQLDIAGVNISGVPGSGPQGVEIAWGNGDGSVEPWETFVVDLPVGYAINEHVLVGAPARLVAGPVSQNGLQPQTGDAIVIDFDGRVAGTMNLGEMPTGVGVAADLDGNGLGDVVSWEAVDTNGGGWLQLQTSPGVFEEGTWLIPMGTRPLSPYRVTASMTGESQEVYVSALEGPAPDYDVGSHVIMDRVGIVEMTPELPVGEPFSTVRLDLNGDGKADHLTIDWGSYSGTDGGWGLPIRMSWVEGRGEGATAHYEYAGNLALFPYPPPTNRQLLLLERVSGNHKVIHAEGPFELSFEPCGP